MHRPKKAAGAALAAVAVVGTLAVSAPPPETAAPGRGLWGAVTIAPGREGIVEASGYEGAALGAGSVLTLTAPEGSEVTGVPFTGSGYRGVVVSGGGAGTYTFAGSAAAVAQAWRGRTFPFVLAVAPDAVPGTRLRGCVLRLTDARGAVQDQGTCEVTVGLPGPTLTRPESGVPLPARPEIAGTAYPGAQVTVRDALENEVCATTATAVGSWSCVPGPALPSGPGRLQATATLNGVSGTSEQIAITVAGAAGRS
ncbi:carboxypeptidase regulatory-like domain-containing protein [Streptomyces sp. NBC_01352]|uniref:Carboxypeptidase regulatory-like domain-containing protein n=1 Tax=Streptomyces plumbiresistens TaxID=511811 RepID=A0ABP7RT65_9ACTN|nr:carboxypeptidase regulatory-like domain-containing protein [Streptomyces sp. NBC_01352]